MNRILDDTEVNIGMGESDRKTIAKGLSKVLADSYTLYLKTHNFHWNITGKHFFELHEQFETQYTELAEAVDEIAERIRALGYRAPGSYKEFNELTSLNDPKKDEMPDAEEMVRQLLEDNEQVIHSCRQALKPAKKADDEATIDLLTGRIDLHAKTAWMLRSYLG